MKISNNYQPSFQAGYMTKDAAELLAHRMKSGEFIAAQEKFFNTFKDSKINVTLGTISDGGDRFNAILSYNTDKKEPIKDVFFKYIEETLFSSIFKSPEKFLNKVYKVFHEEAVPFEKNGYRNLY